NRPSTTPFCFTVATASSSTTSLNTSVIMFLLVRSYTENRTDPKAQGLKPADIGKIISASRATTYRYLGMSTDQETPATNNNSL
ncbi:hypothetical protein D4765_17080, partial [Subtercola vilae]